MWLDLELAAGQFYDFWITEPEWRRNDYLIAIVNNCRKNIGKRMLVSDKFRTFNHLEYGLDQIVISNGGKHSLTLAFLDNDNDIVSSS